MARRVFIAVFLLILIFGLNWTNGDTNTTESENKEPLDHRIGNVPCQKGYVKGPRGRCVEVFNGKSNEVILIIGYFLQFAEKYKIL